MARKRAEHSRAYNAFLVYRDLGHGRSRREVAKRIGASPDTVCRWARDYRWDERLVEYKDEVKKKNEAGALLAHMDDPVLKKAMTAMEQVEALIDSAFLPDDTGKISPLFKPCDMAELTALISEYRKMLESYHRFMAEYKPDLKGKDRATKIDKFNVFVGDMSQQERIEMMESLKNGNVPRRNSRASGGISEADYQEVPKRGNED